VQPHWSAYAVVRDPTDVIGRRIAALVIDWFLALALLVILGLGLAEQHDYPTMSRAQDACDRINDRTDDFCIPLDDTVLVYTGGEVVLILLLPLAFHFLDDALLTGVTGFSIGKGLVGLRVIRQSDGRLCGVGRSMLRWLLWVADGAPYCLPIVGLATGLATKGHRRVGDMAAGTLVVDKHDVGVAPVVPGLNAMTPPPWTPTAQTPPPSWGAPSAAPPWGPPSTPNAPGSYGTPAAPPASSAPGWGAPPASGPPPPASWGPPATTTGWGQQQAPASAPGSTPGVDSPLWDDARDTYIQWDPDLAAWVQWDEAAHEWHPIV
jgi:hypothetical protein